MTTLLDKLRIPGTLSHQVRVAARQAAERRRAVRLRRAALGEHLHETLTSPDMLLFAAGTGFVIGEFAGRPGPARDSKQPPKPRQRPMARAEAALRFAFKIFTLAHAATTVMAGPREIPNG
ncbi:MAG TPA: hypothetical protein VK830_01895 [Xanthomonadales bacterium]|nr:hypothetical protein [Xanthomonadales bacterium]